MAQALVSGRWARHLEIGADSTRQEPSGEHGHRSRIDDPVLRAFRELTNAALSIDTRNASPRSRTVLATTQSTTSPPAERPDARRVAAGSCQASPAHSLEPGRYATRALLGTSSRMRSSWPRQCADAPLGARSSESSCDPGIGFGKTLEHNLACSRAARLARSATDVVLLRKRSSEAYGPGWRAAPLADRVLGYGCRLRHSSAAPRTAGAD